LKPISQIKNTTEWLKKRPGQEEERMSEYEVRALEIFPK
jgi:hypothetical protein